MHMYIQYMYMYMYICVCGCTSGQCYCCSTGHPVCHWDGGFTSMQNMYMYMYMDYGSLSHIHSLLSSASILSVCSPLPSHPSLLPPLPPSSLSSLPSSLLSLPPAPDR